MLQTVIFDMDGVIVDTEPVHHYAYFEHFKELNIKVSEARASQISDNSKTCVGLGMILTGSEKAQYLRSAILDVVIDVLNQRLGGKTKFINQREEEFLPSAIREYNYRQEFTNSLDYYITENKFKYGQLTDKIYKSIFKENAKEYRQILKLNNKESVRGTMYSEVLDLIAGFENGFSSFLKSNNHIIIILKQ